MGLDSMNSKFARYYHGEMGGHVYTVIFNDKDIKGIAKARDIFTDKVAIGTLQAFTALQIELNDNDGRIVVGANMAGILDNLLQGPMFNLTKESAE